MYYEDTAWWDQSWNICHSCEQSSDKEKKNLSYCDMQQKYNAQTEPPQQVLDILNAQDVLILKKSLLRMYTQHS